MNTALYVLISAIIIYIIRYFIATFIYKEKSRKYLIVSFFVINTILNYGLPIYELSFDSAPGVFGNKIRIEGYFFLIILLIISKRNSVFPVLEKRGIIYFTIFVLFILISMFNPINVARIATLIAFYNFITFFAFSYLVIRTIGHVEIVKGLWDGLAIATIIQFVLIILYPIMGISEVIQLFRGEYASVRIERPGGIGTFPHPNVLSAYMTLCFVFFQSSYLHSIKKRLSLILSILCIITVAFTYSRTGIAAIFLLFILDYKIHKNPEKPLWSFNNSLQVLSFTSLLLIFTLATPIWDIAANSDIKEMFFARWYHWIYGILVFDYSPIIGVGINSHLEYLRRFISPIVTDYLSSEFAFSNPIHNTFLIILCEAGILGLIIIIVSILYEYHKGKKNYENKNINNYRRHIQLVKIGFLFAICLNGITDKAIFSTNLIQLWIFLLILSLNKPMQRIILYKE